MTAFDPRLHAFRTDLADVALDGLVEAGRFVAPQPATVRVGVADLRKAPRDDAPLDSQLLFGEPVACFERSGGWAWVQSGIDGYVGYVRSVDLGPAPAAGAEPDHRVAELGTFLYPEPRLKAPRLDRLSLGALVRVGESRGTFVEVPGAGWVVSRHLAPRGQRAPDYVATALRFLGLPYLWGGRSSLGLDCSALVQLALAHAGVPCPRDSDHQAAGLGRAVERPGRPPALERGDLVYMPGHVVIALDRETVVNANAFHMLVSVEPLAAVCARIAAESGRPLKDTIDAIRRP
jgi:cell wall-associated NlpC family hydrolase